MERTRQADIQVLNELLHIVTQAELESLRTKTRHAEGWLALAVQILECLNRSDERTSAIGDIVRLVKDCTGFEAVGVRLRNGEDFPYYIAKGFPVEFTEAESYLCARDGHGQLIRDLKGNPYLECMCGNVISGRTNPSLRFFTEGGSFWTNSTSDLLASTSAEDLQAPVRRRCNRQGYESVALMPLRSNNEIIGLLQLNDSRKNAFTPSMIRFFEKVGFSIGVALARMQTEEALWASEERLRAMFDSAVDGITVTDLKGRIVQTNEAMVRMCGYENRAELVGRNAIESLMKKDDSEEALEGVNKTLREGSVVRTELTCVRKDGTEFPVEIATAVLKDNSGNPRGLVTITKDITERKQAEDGLLESESRLRSLFETMSEGVVLIAPDGQIIRANPAAERIVGLKRSEIEGHRQDSPEWKAFRPDGTVMRPEEMAGPRAMSEKRPIEDMVMGMERPDGSVSWINVNARPIINKEGDVDLVVLTFADVTERKRAEEALRASEERYRAIFEQAADSIVLVDVETGALVEFNDRAHENLGYTRDEFKKLKIPDFEVIESAEEVVRHIERVHREGTDTFETKHRTKCGEIRDIQVRSRAISIAGREFIQSIWQDITQRKKGERALRESEEKLRAMFDSVVDGITVTDLGGDIVDMNEAMLNMYGYDDKAELVGRNTLEFISEDERAKAAENMNKSLKEGYVRGAEYTCLGKDGREFPIELSAALLKDNSGNPTGFVTVAKDITERQKAKRERQRIEGQLRQAQKMEALGRLAGGVAHDFNNLLTAIRGYSDLGLMKISEENKVYGDLTHIREASIRAANLTRQLLLFGRRQPAAFKPLDLNDVVSDLLGMLKRLIGENYSIATDLAPGLWVVSGDAGHLAQIVMNMVVNAKDAMPEGGRITVRTENLHLGDKLCKSRNHSRPGDFVRLSIKDTGIGMNGTTMSRAFEPFFTTKKAGEGTGLGLSVAYGIVRQHAGWIDVDSAVGKGSTFMVYLPAASEDAVQEDRHIGRASEPRGQGERILLVEDEEDVKALTERMLRESGYAVFGASSAREASGIFERKNGEIDMVFSDVVLPDENGVKLVDRLLDRKPELRVLLASGYTQEPTTWQVIQEKGYRFLQKPYVLGELLEAVRRLLDEN